MNTKETGESVEASSEEEGDGLGDDSQPQSS